LPRRTPPCTVSAVPAWLNRAARPFLARGCAVPIETWSIPGFSDPVSSLTHLLGAAVFACLTPFLIVKGRGNPWRIASLAVFAFSTVLLLSLSGTYHLLSPGTAGRAVLQRLDHGAIFILIAGTFTPLHVILFRGVGRWPPLLVLWAAAAVGVTLKSVFFDDLAEWLGLVLYLGMGWLGAISATAIWRRHGARFLLPLLLGGAAYTAGAVFEFLRWPVAVAGVVGPHELFHVMVLLGAAFHWRFVWRFACGTIPPRRGATIAHAWQTAVTNR
jgi:channel protein (hemolysin III family)